MTRSKIFYNVLRQLSKAINSEKLQKLALPKTIGTGNFLTKSMKRTGSHKVGTNCMVYEFSDMNYSLF